MSKGLIAIAILLAAGYFNPSRGQSPASILKWTSLGPEGGGVTFMALDTQNSNIVYAATTVGVFKSRDYGANWTDTGLTGYSVGRLAVDLHDSNAIYALTEGRNDNDSIQTNVFKKQRRRNDVG